MKCILLFLLSMTAYVVSGQTKTISGKILDINDAPFEYAVVTLFANDSILLLTTQVDSSGIYSINFNHVSGSYKLMVSIWGTKLHEETIPYFESPDLIKDIRLDEMSALALNEVVVEGRRNTFALRNDRYVYTPDITLLTSNTAFDILKQTPMLNVNDDNISLIFKESTQVYLNNRPLRMPVDALINYLKSMPSDNIKNIEIITNPGSQFDASHLGGIINIVLHKNEDEGFLGRLAARDVQGRSNSQIAAFSFEFKKNKFGLQGGITGNNSQSRPKQINEIIDNNSNSQYIVSRDYYKNRGVNFNLNVAYTLSEQHILNFFTTNRITPYTSNSISHTDYGNIITPNVIDSTILTNIDDDGKTRNIFFNLGYLYKIDNKGQQLDISADYMDYNRKTNQYTDFYLVEQNEDLINKNKLFTHTLQEIQSFSIKADYTYPLEKWKLNLGGLYTNYRTNNQNNIEDGNNSNYGSPYNRDVLFDYQEHISALYASLDYSLSEKINMSIGVRSEYTKINFDLMNSDVEGERNNYLDIYPSARFNYNINDEWMLNYSLSTKVQRPTSWQLNPFISYSNENTYASGNPALENVYIYNQELILLWNNQYSLNINHAYSKNDVGQFFAPDPNFSHLNYYGFFNYGDRNNIYTHLNIPVNLFKGFWKSNLSVGAQYSHFKIDNPELGQYYKNTNSINGIFFIYNTFQLSQKNNLWAYLNFQYFSPNMYLVKENIAYPSFNLEIRKSWADWTVSLLGNYGIYNGKGISRLKSDQHFAPYLKEMYTLYPDFNNISIRLTYSFGNSKVRTSRNAQIANRDIQNRVQ